MSQDPVSPQDAAGDASANPSANPAEGAQAQAQNGEAGNAAPLTLEQQLQQAEAKASEHHDAWLRAKAETENMRKRALLDVASAENPSPASSRAEPASHGLGMTNAPGASCSARNATAFSS